MLQLVKALLAHGANPNVRIEKDFQPYSRSPYALQVSLVGMTPFLLAAAAADVGLMRALLAGGANPHINSKDGSTALMMVAGLGRVDERLATTLMRRTRQAARHCMAPPVLERTE
jgi:ankyrin repeat protein